MCKKACEKKSEASTRAPPRHRQEGGHHFFKQQQIRMPLTETKRAGQKPLWNMEGGPGTVDIFRIAKVKFCERMPAGEHHAGRAGWLWVASSCSPGLPRGRRVQRVRAHRRRLDLVSYGATRMVGLRGHPRCAASARRSPQMRTELWSPPRVGARRLPSCSLLGGGETRRIAL